MDGHARPPGLQVGLPLGRVQLLDAGADLSCTLMVRA
jgi:hypothetical protein